MSDRYDYEATLRLVDRQLKQPQSLASVMAATVYLVEARKIRKQMEVIK